MCNIRNLKLRRFPTEIGTAATSKPTVWPRTSTLWHRRSMRRQHCSQPRCYRRWQGCLLPQALRTVRAPMHTLRQGRSVPLLAWKDSEACTFNFLGPRQPQLSPLKYVFDQAISSAKHSTRVVYRPEHGSVSNCADNVFDDTMSVFEIWFSRSEIPTYFECRVCRLCGPRDAKRDIRHISGFRPDFGCRMCPPKINQHGSPLKSESYDS